MAYNVYVACDRCGEQLHISCNNTRSMTKAIEKAMHYGWEVTRKKNCIDETEFFCPDCREIRHKGFELWE